ncbi:hypothetical protein VP01_533g3 [Puccinia sorghi]|uniref:DUF7872 domain-containing protein n=1 Tax=Puccinia sorghi TaxID=27349 RepID=A0A0L6UM44_9BASI|nr:hypothetical protein VP01_533g3 [Puccinia sorghi]
MSDHALPVEQSQQGCLMRCLTERSFVETEQGTFLDFNQLVSSRDGTDGAGPRLCPAAETQSPAVGTTPNRSVPQILPGHSVPLRSGIFNLFFSFQEFALQNGAQNFHCGIGEKCNIGELCHPVKGLAWYSLFAIQEFNLFMNSVYRAVGTTMDLVRRKSPILLLTFDHHRLPLDRSVKKMEMMTLLQPNEKLSKKHHKEQLWFDSFMFLTAITMSLSVGLLVGMSTLTADSTWFTVGELTKYLGLASGATFTGFAIASMAHRSTEHQPTAFDYWSQFAFYFGQCQAKMQEGIATSLRQTLDQGIAKPGTTQSLADLLAHGTFLNTRTKKTSPEVEAALKDVTQIRALVILLRSMNAFVTRGSEPCRGRGTNGAWEEKDHLSFCGPDNVMMNIVLGRGDRVENTIHNAQVIAVNARPSMACISTPTSARTSPLSHPARPPLDNFPTALISALPTDPNADCLVNLPVCDCTRQGTFSSYLNALHKNPFLFFFLTPYQTDIQVEIRKSGIVPACRKIGNLKI